MHCRIPLSRNAQMLTIHGGVSASQRPSVRLLS
jgi:hypothetical protein